MNDTTLDRLIAAMSDLADAFRRLPGAARRKETT